MIDFVRKCNQYFYFIFKVNRSAERLIIFFIEGPWQKALNEKITGGITSIESIYEQTRTLQNIHQAETVLCTLSGKRIYRFTTFNSHSRIIHFDFLKRFYRLNDVLIHIPEYFVKELLFQLENGQLKKILKSKNYQLNILNQNIELMPDPGIVMQLKKYFTTVTQTTAHRNYNSDKFLAKYNIPFHFFSARIDISQYSFVPFHQKENLILFSPDDKEKNEKIINLLKTDFSYFQFKVIENITYPEYKKLIGRAKFCFTFGEGLDGYFVEPFFCGTISFAIYNELFFSTEYRSLLTVVETEEYLYNNISKTINLLLDETAYNLVVGDTNKLLTVEYNYDDYVNNIKLFYERYFKSSL